MTGHTDNAVVIDAPMDLVWDMTNNVDSWPELFSEYSAVEVLRRSDDTMTFRLTMHPDPQGNQWSWVSERIVSQRTRTVRARRLERGWFTHMHILWSFRPTPAGVEMRWIQDFAMREDSPVGVDTMTQRLNGNTVAQQERIKKLVESAARGAR